MTPDEARAARAFARDFRGTPVGPATGGGFPCDHIAVTPEVRRRIRAGAFRLTLWAETRATRQTYNRKTT